MNNSDATLSTEVRGHHVQLLTLSPISYFTCFDHDFQTGAGLRVICPLFKIHLSIAISIEMSRFLLSCGMAIYKSILQSTKVRRCNFIAKTGGRTIQDRRNFYQCSQPTKSN